MSSAVTAPALRKTALNSTHRQLGAKMVDFGGWDMPVEYSGLTAEHLAVRTGVGVFDVSHMGDIQLRGPSSLAAVQRISMNDASKLAIGQAHYSALLYPQGTFVDDVIVHKLSENDYLLVINAGTREKDYQWVRSQIGAMPGVHVSDYSDYYTQLAIQGPRAAETLAKLTNADLSAIKNYWFTWGTVCGLANTLIARTGYTGEDGFEIYVPSDEPTSVRVWNEVLEAGREFGILPCGLGARNTLRLESAMALYGHEISAELNVFEAGLDRYCKLEKGPFRRLRGAGKDQGRRRPEAQAGRPGGHRTRHRPRRLRRLRWRRQADRLRHQRVARAVSQEEHCAGLRAARSCRRRFRSHCAVPIEPGARQSRSAALLSPPEKAGLSVIVARCPHVEKPLFNSCRTINSTKTTCRTHRN